MDQLSEMIYRPKLEVFLLHMSGYYRPYVMPKDTYLTGSFQTISNTSAQCNLKLYFQSVVLYPMTDPWCWYITQRGYTDGIHGTPYIAAPWILYTNGERLTWPSLTHQSDVQIRTVLGLWEQRVGPLGPWDMANCCRLQNRIYYLVNIQKTIENGHRNRWFTHK